MAKGMHRGFAKPDDPIYSTGLTIGGKHFPKSTDDSEKSTDGTERQALEKEISRLTESTSKAPKTTGRSKNLEKLISNRFATEEDYAKRQNWQVGTFHRRWTPPQPREELEKEVGRLTDQHKED